MKEARIIFPVLGPLNEAMQAALHMIYHAFGGATVFPAEGYWLHPNGSYIQEPVRVADIAYEPSDENDRKLFDIAWHLRAAANQVEVYLRYGNGNVQMVQELSCMNNGEFDWNSLVDSVHRPQEDLTDVVEQPSNSFPEHAVEQIARYLR